MLLLQVRFALALHTHTNTQHKHKLHIEAICCMYRIIAAHFSHARSVSYCCYAVATSNRRKENYARSSIEAVCYCTFNILERACAAICTAWVALSFALISSSSPVLDYRIDYITIDSRYFKRERERQRRLISSLLTETETRQRKRKRKRARARKRERELSCLRTLRFRVRSQRLGCWV